MGKVSSVRRSLSNAKQKESRKHKIESESRWKNSVDHCERRTTSTTTPIGAPFVAVAEDDDNNTVGENEAQRNGNALWMPRSVLLFTMCYMCI